MGEIDARRASCSATSPACFRGSEGAPGRWRGMEMFLNNPVAADDPRLTAVYDNFRRNLTDICGIARRAQCRGRPFDRGREPARLSAAGLAAPLRPDCRGAGEMGVALQGGRRVGSQRPLARGAPTVRGGGEDRRPLRGTPVSHRPVPDEGRPLGRGTRAIRAGPRSGRPAVPRRLPHQCRSSARWPASKRTPASVSSMPRRPWPNESGLRRHQGATSSTSTST